jgi:type I restriction-modification system DNA methylase subunit
MSKKSKMEALSVGRLINEVLINRLGIPLNNIVNDTTFSKYTGSKRPDLLISNIGYDGNNDMQFIKNLVCYAEAKDPSCTVGDKDWKDGYNQGRDKAPKLGLKFFGITNCKTTYFYNVNTEEKLSLNGNLISEFQTLDVFRIIRKSLNENPLLSNIKMGPEALTSVSEAVFGKKLWELAEEYREVDFANNIQKIDFTVGMIALEYFEEKEQIEGTKDNSKLYWSDSRSIVLDQAAELVTKLITYIDWLIADDSEFNEFSPLLKKVRSLISGSRPLINAKKLYAIYNIIDSMHPLHGTGFDLFGAVYQNFANSKEKKDFGEYFTSRHYSHVLAELLLKNEDVFNINKSIKIIDPFCGTGGMLTESFKVLKSNYQRTGMYDDDATEYLAKKCFYGIDIRSENISRTRLNMFLVGDGHTNMYQDNSLIPETKTGKKYLSQKYSYAITNPPYGSGTIQANTDVISSKRMEIAALCRIMDLLEINGCACVITPDGILENPSFMKFRDEIMRTCEIYAIISLPKFAFAPYTKEKTYALYLKKKHDRPTSNDKKKHLPTGKYQLSKIWMYIIDNDGFANSDKRFPTRLRGADQAWLHDEVQGYVDNDGNQHQSILEQRWLTFDDQLTNGTEWIDESGELVKKRKGGFIPIETIAKDEFLTLLPEYYLRPYKPHYLTENEFKKELYSIENEIKTVLGSI